MSAYTAPKVPTILTRQQRYRLHTWLTLDLEGYSLGAIQTHLRAVKANSQHAKRVREAKVKEARKESAGSSWA